MPLHPVISQMFLKMAEAGRPALSAGTPSEARAMVAASRAALGQGPALHQVQELRLPTRSGTIAARLYTPSTHVEGLVVYLHGGGWVVGELDDYDTMVRTLAERSNCAVLAPDYRLAPEHPFPAALEDAEDAVTWAATRIPELAGAEVPFLVAGDSAGANLATVVTNALAAYLPIVAQVLVYPVTDADTRRDSYLNCSEGMQLTRADMEWFFRHYAPSELHSDPRISPLRQPPRRDLPSTVVFTAEYDVLRDEGEAYARHLADAGVFVTLRRVDSLPHGFIRLHNLVDAADVALSAIAEAIAGCCAMASTNAGDTPSTDANHPRRNS